MAQVECSVWGVVFDQHKEAIPPEAIRWLERGYAMQRLLRGSGRYFVVPEFDLERLTVVQDELRRELGLATY